MAEFEHKEKRNKKKKVTAGRIIDWCPSFHPLNYLSESTRPAASVKSCVNFDYSKSGCCQTDPKSGCDATLLSKRQGSGYSSDSFYFCLGRHYFHGDATTAEGAHQRDIY